MPIVVDVQKWLPVLTILRSIAMSTLTWVGGVLAHYLLCLRPREHDVGRYSGLRALATAEKARVRGLTCSCLMKDLKSKSSGLVSLSVSLNSQPSYMLARSFGLRNHSYIQQIYLVRRSALGVINYSSR